MRAWSIVAMMALVGCTGSTEPDDEESGSEDSTIPVVPSETGTRPPPIPVPQPTGETGTPEPGELRPPVEQRAPNATGQTPAFPEQTRAPQPAEDTDFVVQTVTSDLDRPWGFAILPDGRFLVNQKGGSMVIVTTLGDVSDPISGVPPVQSASQGGLLDVVLDPDFATNRFVYWSFSEPRNPGWGTSVARGVLAPDEASLTDVEVIFQQLPAYSGFGHYGSRLAFAPDGNLFVTLGDRQDEGIRVNAQDPKNTIGSVVRIAPDGSIPGDNPFVGDAAGDDAVWSYGHRNPQSAAIDLQGRLWTVEHGPQGGDELNRPQPKANYGWPDVTYGEDYGGGPIGDGITELAGTEQPVYYWDPVIAPAGMAVYDGTLFAGWQGDFLIGGLQSRGIVRLSIRDDTVYTEEWLDLGTRCRDVAVGANGEVYVATDDGRLLRLVPAPE